MYIYIHTTSPFSVFQLRHDKCTLHITIQSSESILPHEIKCTSIAIERWDCGLMSVWVNTRPVLHLKEKCRQPAHGLGCDLKQCAIYYNGLSFKRKVKESEEKMKRKQRKKRHPPKKNIKNNNKKNKVK